MRQYKVELLIEGESFKKAMHRFKDTELVFVEDLGEKEEKQGPIGFKKLDNDK